MAASTADKLTATFNSANPNVARVTSNRTAGTTTLACDNLAGWPTASKVHFATYRIDANNNVISGSQIDWSGIVSGNNITSLTRLAGATDAGSTIGDVVEAMPTGSWAQGIFDWGTTFSDTQGNLLLAAILAAIGTGGITGTQIGTGAVTLPKLGTGGNFRLGLNTKTTTGTVLTTTYTTYCTVTATSAGGEVELTYIANIHDAGSGSARLANVRVQCDGVTVTGSEDTNVQVALNGGTGWGLTISHTPTAGSHTWTLQILATAASATVLDQASLRVAEVK